jgi:SOS response regulatory protein OraA/RecX
MGRPLSAAELRKRLLNKGFAPAATEAALEAMRGYRYIDDVKFAETIRASAARQGKGPKWIAHTLTQRGVDAQTVRAAARVPEAESLAAATALVTKRFGSRPDRDNPKIRQRALRLLATRGFAGSCAYAAVRAALGARGDDTDPDMC